MTAEPRVLGCLAISQGPSVISPCTRLEPYSKFPPLWRKRDTRFLIPCARWWPLLKPKTLVTHLCPSGEAEPVRMHRVGYHRWVEVSTGRRPSRGVRSRTVGRTIAPLGVLGSAMPSILMARAPGGGTVLHRVRCPLNLYDHLRRHRGAPRVTFSTLVGCTGVPWCFGFGRNAVIEVHATSQVILSEPREPFLAPLGLVGTRVSLQWCRDQDLFVSKGIHFLLVPWFAGVDFRFVVAAPLASYNDLLDRGSGGGPLGLHGSLPGPSRTVLTSATGAAVASSFCVSRRVAQHCPGACVAGRWGATRDLISRYSYTWTAAKHRRAASLTGETYITLEIEPRSL